MTRLIVGAVVVAAAVGGVLAWNRGNGSAPRYRLAKAERGDLLVTVNATGTLQPMTSVQVGTQVSGTVQKLFADFNSRVKAGEVIAQIDPALFQTRVDQDRANLARAEADVERVKASLVQAENDLARARSLAKQDLISASDLDAAVANHGSLAAQVKVVEATVAQNRAALRNSEVNLQYTTIVSPVDGIVVSRNVDTGQTVAASLQAPTLFLIADDLKRLQAQVSVPEADIGRIGVGQAVAFTVDAFPQTRFRGKVEQVRLSATTVQNVVTYTVIASAANPEEKLLPGMTANVTFEVDRRENALLVPNAALRFTPADAPPDAPVSPRGKGREGGKKPRQRLWVPAPEGPPRAVPVAAGSTDGNMTEIVEGELKEGQEVIVGRVLNAGDAAVTNPFAAPQGRGGGRPR